MRGRMSSKVAASDEADDGLRLSKKRRKVKKSEAAALKNRAFSERTRKKRAHESKLAKADADRRARDRELHEEKRKVISAQLRAKRDAAEKAKAAMIARRLRRAKRLQAIGLCARWAKFARALCSPKAYDMGEGVKAKDQLGMTKWDCRVIQGAFDMIDVDGSGSLNYDEFWEFMRDLNSSNREGSLRSVYTDRLFKMFDTDGNGTLEYDEFFGAVIMFSMYNRDDITQFCFETFDTDQSGFIEEEEFIGLIKSINREEPLFPGNFYEAISAFDVNDDGVIDIHEFRDMCRQFPLIFHPAYHMQQLVQRATLGERRWHTFHVREERKLRIMRYRKEHAGQYPPLGCCWSTLMSMGFRNPQAKLIGDDSDILPKHTEDRKAKSQDEIFAKIIENLDSTQEEAKQREEEEHQARVFGNRIR